MKNTKKGFKCACGKQNTYPAYVYAHAREVLTFTCKCGRKYEIQEMSASLYGEQR